MHTKIFDLGSQSVKIETGLIAKQTDSSVLVDIDGTVILATLVAAKEDSDRDFFPLTVNYNEKTYAAGKIPGGFFKREGRPTESETLISRLIDRPLRPLFDSSFTREVQLIVTLISHNPEVDPEVAALIASSAAVKLSGLPFNGTLGAVKVGYDGENYLLNPKKSDLDKSLLDLTVAGTESAVMMVESEAYELSEKEMLGNENRSKAENYESIAKNSSAVVGFIAGYGLGKATSGDDVSKFMEVGKGLIGGTAARFVADAVTENQETVRLLDTISLYVPQSVVTAYTAQWDEVDLGPFAGTLGTGGASMADLQEAATGEAVEVFGRGAVAAAANIPSAAGFGAIDGFNHALNTA